MAEKKGGLEGTPAGIAIGLLVGVPVLAIVVSGACALWGIRGGVALLRGISSLANNKKVES